MRLGLPNRKASRQSYGGEACASVNAPMHEVDWFVAFLGSG
jgi:hypothetical protein